LYNSIECFRLGNILLGGEGYMKEMIGLRIRKFREEKKMTLEDLGEKLGGISKGYISKLERGLKPINLENLQKIANALDVDVTDLFPHKEKTDNPFTGDEDWLFVMKELKEKGFSPSEVYLKMAQQAIEKDKESK
jgi:XRE family transcriptional regulator, master regulator for biofilm formation